MKSNARNIRKQRLLLLIISSSILLVIFFPFISAYIKSIFSGNPISIEDLFIVKDDWITQAIPFHSLFFKNLDSFSLQWNWNLLFGADLSVTKTGLILYGDIFAIVGYFINKITNYVPTTLFIITILKMITANQTFNFFLEKYEFQFKTRLIFSISYMLGGWALIFIEQPLFLSFYAFLPLVLAGVENIFRKQSYTLFIISCTIMLITSFYLSWSFCIYLLMYWIYRSCILKYSAITFIKSSLKTLGAFSIALLISAYIWLPALTFIINSPRLMSTGLSTQTSWNLNNCLSILSNFFIPVTKFSNTFYNDPWYYFSQIGIYSGVFSLLILPQYFIHEDNKHNRLITAIFLTVILLTLVSPKVGFIFQFTYSLRYSFIVSITLLLLSAITFDKYLDKFSAPLLWITEIFIISTITIIGFLIPTSRGLNLSIYPESSMFLIACFSSVILFSLLIVYRKKKKLGILFIFFSILELVIQSKFIIRSQTENTSQFVDYLKNENEVKNTFEELKKYDQSFYRVNLDVNPSIDKAYTRNFGIYYDIPTITIYDTLYNYTVYDFLDFLRLYPSTNWNFGINEPSIFEFLNTKYSIVSANSDLVYYEYIGNEVDLPGISNNYRVFLNNGNYGLVRSYNMFYSQSDLHEMSKNYDGYYLHEITAILNDYAVVSEDKVIEYSELFSQGKQQSYNPETFSSNSLNFNITLDYDTYMIFSIPASKGWKLYDNGIKIDYEEANGGFIAIPLNKGIHNLTLRYSTPMMTLAIILTVIGIVEFSIVIFWNKHKINK
ncbi:MAG: YfhO family protein [Bacilli bacterium]